MNDLHNFLEGWSRKFRRVGYYTTAAAKECIPHFLYSRRLERIYEKLWQRADIQDILNRVEFYNKFDGPIAIDRSVPIRNIKVDHTYRYFDFKQAANFFDGKLRVDLCFKDVNWIPKTPQITKSRPIQGDNRNAILLKLSSFRNYNWSNDTRPFRAKAGRAVWRGVLNNPLRKALMRRHGESKIHDIGHTSNWSSDIPPKRFLSLHEQLGCRYILSIEGYDIATNLKWIMSSNSLCLTPRPRIESWFMESTLRPGVHYAELRNDFSDLDEKIAFYQQNPEAAEAIIEAAHAHIAQFLDQERELAISLLVLQKYFELSGQMPPRFFAGKV